MSKTSRSRWEQSQSNLELCGPESGTDVVAKTIAPVLPLRAENNRAEFALQLDRWIAEGRGQIHTKWLTIGADEAAEMLSRSGGNRNESEASIGAYARAQKNNEWTATGLTAQFDINGVFIDAHTRMRSIVASKMQVLFGVTFGLPPRARDVIDQGDRRGLSGVMKMRGLEMSSKQVASVRAYGRLLNGETKHYVKLTLGEFDALVASCQRAIAAITDHMHTKWPGSFWGAVLFAYDVAPGVVEKFALDAVRGTGLGAGSPAWTMREYLQHASSAGQQHQYAIMVRALYAIRAAVEGRALSRFSPRDEDQIVKWFSARRRTAVV